LTVQLGKVILTMPFGTAIRTDYPMSIELVFEFDDLFDDDYLYPFCAQRSRQSDSLARGMKSEARPYSGLSRCWIYCFRIESGAPLHDMLQYERDQNTGLR